MEKDIEEREEIKQKKLQKWADKRTEKEKAAKANQLVSAIDEKDIIEPTEQNIDDIMEAENTKALIKELENM